MARGWVASDDTFGARLALVRQRMGWGNVKEAAIACGLPVESWRNWERDGRLPRDLFSVCRAVSERTGADLGWLMGLMSTGGPSGTEGDVSGSSRLSEATLQNLRYSALPVRTAA